MLRKRTRNVALLVVLVIGTVAVGLTRAAPVASQDDAEAKIESAMSAAPATLTEQATILDSELDDAGTFVVLRDGSNGWFCQADAPGTPGPDPLCFDQTWLDWVYAFVAGEEPNVTVAGDEWMTSPPHVMLLLPEDLVESGFSADYQTGGPWIMWAGTPYEHIMMPVAEGEMME